jgi:hypothetical protein
MKRVSSPKFQVSSSKFQVRAGAKELKPETWNLKLGT